jgi:hypothetical protein
MDEACKKMIEGVMKDREEILKAFIAKYGFEPDEALQIVQGNSWCVVRQFLYQTNKCNSQN